MLCVATIALTAADAALSAPPACNVTSKSQSGEEAYYMNNFMPLGDRRSRGVYVEIGALDGWTHSNTRVLSKCHGWSGLLVEGNLKNYGNLLQRMDRKNVTVHHSAVCEAPLRWATMTLEGGAVATDTTRVSAQFQRKWKSVNRPSRTVRVPCAPMHELLGDIAHVDFFSLDVEGAELTVVNTIDFRRVTIDTFVVELDGHDKGKDARVAYVLGREGYARCKVVYEKGSKIWGYSRNGWFRKDCHTEGGATPRPTHTLSLRKSQPK